MAEQGPRSLEITISGETYSLDVVPAPTSAIVSEERKTLLGDIDLETFVTELSSIGAFVRLANYSAIAAGHKCTDLQIQIQRIGYDIVKLCDKSALTVSQFERASKTVLEDLQGTYEYLLDGEEELALMTLSAVSEQASKMEQACLELHRDFDNEAEVVKTAKEATQKEKQAQNEKIQQCKEDRERYETERQIKMDQIAKSQELEREARASRRMYEEKENKEIKKIGHVGMHLVNSFTQTYFGVEMFDEEQFSKKASQWKKKRIEALQMEEKHRQQRYEAIERRSELTMLIKRSETEENFAIVADKALGYTIGALKDVAALMLMAARFWNQLKEHCKHLADEKVKKQVEAVKHRPREERQKIWTSRVFKKNAIHFYAGWVALRSVCTEYMQHIKVAQKQLYANIRENPTAEHAYAVVKPMADELEEKMKKDQRAIEERNEEARNEMGALAQDENDGMAEEQ